MGQNIGMFLRSRSSVLLGSAESEHPYSYNCEIIFEVTVITIPKQTDRWTDRWTDRRPAV